MSAPPPSAAPGLPLRRALGTGAAAGALACVVLTVALLRDGPLTPFGPGELDVLLTARSMASGVWPPLWAGAVHPDAPGTWLGAVPLVPLLRLGVPDVLALKLLAGLHLFLLVGAAAGLVARRAGARAALVTGALLALAPAVIAAHSKYLATTVEVTGVELALLWVGLELDARGRGPLPWLLLGLGAGVATVYSLHAALLLVLGALALLTRRRWASLGAFLASSFVATLPFRMFRDPLAPPRDALSVKSLGPADLLGLLDPADLGTLLTRAPFALLHGTEHLPAESALRWLHAPAVLAAAGAVAWGAVRLTRSLRGPAAPDRWLAALTLFALGAAAPLLVAGDLLGYPAAYRYWIPPLAAAFALLGLALRPPLLWAALALALPGLLTTPRSTATELTRPMAAYVAGQHRLAFTHHPLHTHFLMLTPFVTDAELAGWLQGYGLHLGREFARQVPTERVEYAAQRVDPRVGVPDRVNRRWHKQQPERWLEAADWLGSDGRQHLLLGVGLGLAEDGRLEPLDVALLQATEGADRAALWRGVGVALGERWHWIHDDAPLQVDADLPALDAASLGMVHGGLYATGGPDSPDLDRLLGPALRGNAPLRSRNQLRLAHPHPFTYADLGVLGRGEVPQGPR